VPRGLTVAEKDEKVTKAKDKEKGSEEKRQPETDPKLVRSLGKKNSADSSMVAAEASSYLLSDASSSENRLERIKQSHSLLKQFTAKELKVLMNLKRNTSPKAWTLREDLVVLTLHLSNREIAELLKDRNKEAVKKRLQLLRSKGLTKRQPNDTSTN
jgi:hypothetical protein